MPLITIDLKGWGNGSAVQVTASGQAEAVVRQLQSAGAGRPSHVLFVVSIQPPVFGRGAPQALYLSPCLII